MADAKAEKEDLDSKLMQLQSINKDEFRRRSGRSFCVWEVFGAEGFDEHPRVLRDSLVTPQSNQICLYLYKGYIRVF